MKTLERFILVIIAVGYALYINPNKAQATTGDITTASPAIFANCSSATKCNPVSKTPGELRYNGGKLYINTGTSTTPAWRNVTINSTAY
jgi:hypothetical protein